MRLALSLIDGDAPPAGALDELVAETALADTRLADDANHCAAAALGLLERRVKRRQLIPTPYEPREAPRPGDVKARVRAARTGQHMHPNGLAYTFDVELAEVFE